MGLRRSSLLRAASAASRAFARRSAACVFRCNAIFCVRVSSSSEEDSSDESSSESEPDESEDESSSEDDSSSDSSAGAALEEAAFDGGAAFVSEVLLDVGASFAGGGFAAGF